MKLRDLQSLLISHRILCTSAGEKEFMVDLLAKIGIGIVLPTCSSPFATGLPVLFCTGFPSVAL